MTTSLHAHIATSSSDCDGGHGYDYIVCLNDEEIAEHARQDGVNDFHDLHFKERVLGGQVSFSPLVKVQVEITESGFTTHEVTDEGYRAAEVYWCEDEACDPNSASQYDQFAEMMGY